MNNISLDLFSIVYGSTQFATALLALVAILLSLVLFARAKQDAAWKLLAVGFILFGIRAVIGALETFSITSAPVLYELSLTGALLFLTIAVVARIATKGARL
ncbi:hypothetical protein GF342_03835 [Candidatus Woesearchaeota archaeon]|nr:hypothetical protein [Candidatus Woesearchaeota archaeon]